MKSMPKPSEPAPDAELFIHLDTAGLGALLKAVEAAMVEGQGRLRLPGGSGTTARSVSSDRFVSVTVTFAVSDDPPEDRGWTGRPDPQPLPRTPVLALQD